MKQLLLIVLLVPGLTFAQSKKKKKQAEEKADMELVNNLRSHIRYLADDKLEGRKAGTPGETLAMQYIVQQYTQMGLEPKGTQGYVQEFEINEGKQIDATTFFKVDGKTLTLMDDYMPLAFSSDRRVTGSPAMSLNEYHQPWFRDLKEILEENKMNPHFDVEERIKKEISKAAAKGATALLVYNTSDIVDNVQFNKNDSSGKTEIPVFYLTKDCIRKYFSDNAATFQLEMNVAFSQNTIRAKNVIGFINNNAPTTVILGAHYDHLGYGDKMHALDTGHLVHHGADDNASGTAALIELVRMLKKNAPVHNNYLIIHFSGEELGLLGSKYWLSHPTIGVTPNYMINMDMVGRYDTSHKLTVGGYGTSPVWSEVWKEAIPKMIYKFDSTGSGPSDHSSFYRNNIPVLFLFTGSHSDYHKASDTWEKINFDGEKDIVKLVYDVISVTDPKGKLAFVKTSEPAMGRSTKFTVTLGVLPDYGYTGTGMRIDGISPGKLAEHAGLQIGDILLQLGDYKFVDVMSYMQALGKFNKGDKTTLRLKRGNEEKTFDITF